jgi:DNA-binding transcriptional MerR regulator
MSEAAPRIEGRAAGTAGAAETSGAQRAGASGAAESALFTVGDLARRARVSPRTIRYYEEIGLLGTARRFSGGRRAFDGDALERLRFIGRLKRLGLSLDEIRHLNDVFAIQGSTAAMLRELDVLLREHLVTIADRIHDLTMLGEEIVAYSDRIQARLKAASEMPSQGDPS